MNRRAIVLINGEIADYARLRSLVQEDDLLVAADGGTRHALAIGRIPDVIVGDLDSIDPAALRDLLAQGVRVETHHPAKDQTDLELAIERALREGAREVLLVGALGGRLDQTVANVLILAQRTWSAPVRIVDAGQSATLLHGPGRMVIAGKPGAVVSAIPFSPLVTGITYSGLEYPLENATLEFGSTRGVSNSMNRSEAVIAIESGVLLVVTPL